jgi:hypothetical protein
LANPVKNSRKAGAQVCERLPAELLGCLAIVGPVENDVAFARLVGVTDGGGPRGNFLHCFSGFAKGNGVLRAATEIEDVTTELRNLFNLKIEKREHVFDKQNVAHLFALPSEIGERKFEPVGDGPPDDPALIGVAELPGSREDAETIDDDRQIVGLRVFLAGGIGNEFAEAVDTALAAIDGEFLGNAVERMKAGGTLLDRNAIPGVGIVFEACGSFAARQSVETIGAVDTIGAPEDQGSFPTPSVFENVDGAKAVVGEVEERVCVSGDDRGLRAGVADQLNAGGKIFEIFGIADIAVEKSGSVARENRDVAFTAAANEIVHDRNFVSRFAEMKSNMRADETAAAGHKYMQEVFSFGR